ncbi:MULTISPECIES: lantibiotic dehydratase [unclassified Streptococcus]|uniref:lantibiotic dehydratase n=1 Tax=unclassified Streptococcus TaxID=2608887 RepID=UPI0010721D21|nr:MULTISPECIES: lantibiotic dehydratase [unclassified Streptococcus]MBF0787074.1 lantibiotic dehydratase [Streptococcus sp. 19428wC2_LYSM12]MCQ9211368.1 lantibiotic dehydratase [Streptococcus sp. B01]MCQ9214680.1 lantibiotic dehydratase [Streptococcus sp. O1]TFV05962.1 hypothetical protein E4T79_04070 [Streptococcus sp. LYSM12]
MYYRQSNYSSELLKNILDESTARETIETVLEDEEFRFCIYTVSKSLYRDIISGNRSQEVIESLRSYLIRMSSRAVAHGAMGVISYSGFENIKLRIYLSLKWLTEFQKLVALNQNENSILKFYLNSNIFQRTASQLIKNFFNSATKKIEKIQLDSNGVIGKILLLIKDKGGISYRELYQQFQSVGNAHKIIEYLIEKEILISEVYFVSRDTADLTKLYKYREFYNMSENELTDVVKSLESLDKIKDVNYGKLIEGIELLSKQLDKLSFNISLKEKFIFENVKSIFSFDNNMHKLDSKQLEFLRYMNVFTHSFHRIKKFESLFYEKFGKYCEVKLATLQEMNMIEEIYMDGYVQSNLFDCDEYLEYWINRLGGKDVDEIVLEDDDIRTIVNSLKKFIDGEFHQFYYDMKYRLYDSGVYLPPVTFAFPSGSYFEKYNRNADYTYTEEEFLYCIDMNLKKYPDVGLQFNEKNKRIYLQEIPNLSNRVLDLADLSIMLDERGLCIRNAKDGHKIIPCFRSMASLEIGTENTIGRFLIDFSNYITMIPRDLYIPTNVNYPVIPRIRFKNYILSKKRWYLRSTQNMLDQDIDSYIIKFIQEYDVPDIVCLNSNGEDFPINLLSTEHINLIKKQLRKINRVVLTEYLGNLNSDHDEVEIIEECKTLGFSYNIKIDNSNVEQFKDYKKEIESKTLVFDSVDKIPRTLEIIKKYFQNQGVQFNYTYYSDYSKPSVRLRYKIRTNIDVFPLLNNLQLENSIIFWFDSEYTYESGRFGGSTGFDDFYEYSYIDGLLAIKHLQLKDRNDGQCVRDILYFLFSIFKNWADTESFLKQFTFTKERRREYSYKFRKFEQNIDYEEMSLGVHKMSKNKYSEFLLQRLSKYSSAHCEYIISSLIHMHANRRLLSIIDEERVIFFCYKVSQRLSHI